jgi:hypothetical protein
MKLGCNLIVKKRFYESGEEVPDCDVPRGVAKKWRINERQAFELREDPTPETRNGRTQESSSRTQVCRYYCPSEYIT